MIETDVATNLKETHHRITQIMQQKIDEYGLTFGLLHITILIDKNPTANQKDLAKELRFTQGAMSSAVKRLIKLDMLKQVPLETDMRYNRLVVTEKGKTILRDYKGYIFRIYKDVFKGFDYNELVKLDNSLSKVNKNLEIMNKLGNLKDLKGSTE